MDIHINTAADLLKFASKGKTWPLASGNCQPIPIHQFNITLIFMLQKIKIIP